MYHCAPRKTERLTEIKKKINRQIHRWAESAFLYQMWIPHATGCLAIKRHEKKCFGERWYLCVTRHSIVRQQWWQGKSRLKNHLYICLHPSKEIDLEWKVKYLPNLMSDIDEKKNDHYINETLQLKKEIEILLLSWPLSPWTWTLNA